MTALNVFWQGFAKSEKKKKIKPLTKSQHESLKSVQEKISPYVQIEI